MKLFLCSYFTEVCNLIEKLVVGKTVLFIPTASKNEDYKEYVCTAKKFFEKNELQYNRTWYIRKWC